MFFVNLLCLYVYLHFFLAYNKKIQGGLTWDILLILKTVTV